MRSLILITTVALAAIGGTRALAQAQEVTADEAFAVANNWLTCILEREGAWGDSKYPGIRQILKLERGRRTLGYLCPVEPEGFIVVSRTHAMPPVRAYSATGRFDPSSAGGLPDLIQDSLERGLDAMVDSVDRDRTADIGKLEDKYRPLWEKLTEDPTMLLKDSDSGQPRTDYQPGTWMLTSRWHQGEPYNAQCPPMDCDYPCGSNQNALVGCPATAGAQIMRYWSWPPYGTDPPYNTWYLWPSMPDQFNGCTWNAWEVDAVAELCSEVGIAFEMNYGCDVSGGGASFLDVLPHFRYSDAAALFVRTEYSEQQWEWLLQSNLDLNRPIYYKIPGHLIVVDGWKDDPGPIRMYHVNYGWGDEPGTAWYAIDDLPGGAIDGEACIANVVPAVALGPTLSGTYPLEAFPFRYFDLDATGNGAVVFQAGQFLQFLPNVVVQAGAGSSITFCGSATGNTRLYAGGDPWRGICIHNATARLAAGGGIRCR